MIFCVLCPRPPTPGIRRGSAQRHLSLKGTGHRWTRARAESIGFPRFTMWNHKPVHGAAICTVHTTPDVYIYIYICGGFLVFWKKWYPKNKPSNYKIIYSKITMLTWGIPEVKKPSYIFIQFISMVENTIEYQLAVYIWWIMVKNATSLWLPAASSWNQL